MPPSRHRATAADPIVVRSLGLTLPPSYRLSAHTHDWHQLVFATAGVMTVRTAHDSWVVPSERAVWIPANVEHDVRTTGSVTMRTLYFRCDSSDSLPTACGVVAVSPLLRELILETVRLGMLRSDSEAQARLAGVLIDQLLGTTAVPLALPLPRDARALRVAKRVQSRPASTPTLSDLVRGSGASARTIERIFARETGMSFGRWVQRAKALHALELLASGESVTSAGLSIGYDSTSAFIAMFKRILGSTPGTYFRSQPAARRN